MKVKIIETKRTNILTIGKIYSVVFLYHNYEEYWVINDIGRLLFLNKNEKYEFIEDKNPSFWIKSKNLFSPPNWKKMLDIMGDDYPEERFAYKNAHRLYLDLQNLYKMDITPDIIEPERKKVKCINKSAILLPKGNKYKLHSEDDFIHKENKINLTYKKIYEIVEKQKCSKLSYRYFYKIKDDSGNYNLYPDYLFIEPSKLIVNKLNIIASKKSNFKSKGINELNIKWSKIVKGKNFKSKEKVITSEFGMTLQFNKETGKEILAVEQNQANGTKVEQGIVQKEFINLSLNNNFGNKRIIGIKLPENNKSKIIHIHCNKKNSKRFIKLATFLFCNNDEKKKYWEFEIDSDLKDIRYNTIGENELPKYIFLTTKFSYYFVEFMIGETIWSHNFDNEILNIKYKLKEDLLPEYVYILSDNNFDILDFSNGKNLLNLKTVFKKHYDYYDFIMSFKDNYLYFYSEHRKYILPSTPEFYLIDKSTQELVFELKAKKSRSIICLDHQNKLVLQTENTIYIITTDKFKVEQYDFDFDLGDINSFQAFDNDLYISCTSNEESKIIVFDLESKKINWIYNSKVKYYPVVHPEKENLVYLTFSDRNYVLIEGNSILALDRETGEIIWQIESDRHSPTTPKEMLFQNDLLYFGMLNSYIYCIDANTGEKKWKYRADSEILELLQDEDSLYFLNQNENTEEKTLTAISKKVN